ncbi:MAG: galactokinase [Kiritimatiellae bacterium]|nr:galactokinase [Kiritimatiellia bacterium]
MHNHDTYDATLAAFRRCYGRAPEVVAYAPGRVEVLGNHTDYNEGYVLSAAIDSGTFFAVARTDAPDCRLTAGDLMREVRFPVDRPEPRRDDGWANYCLGVLAGLRRHDAVRSGFDALFLGNIPLGSGLSSSAALEVSTGLALARLYEIEIDALSLARIGQRAEHLYAGVKCGLLDQISVLFGRQDMLVHTDFRTLDVRTVPLGREIALLICNTHVKHALVDGEYNRRRADCELAAAHFSRVLPHPVTALRDVTWTEWEQQRQGLDERAARRAAHIIGENERVLEGVHCLAARDLAGFGQLMFASHDSSRNYFENSTPELDHLVDAARGIPGVLGARLTGGGFGGSVAALTRLDAAAAAGQALAAAYAARFGDPCEVRTICPSDGARIVMPARQ